MAQKNGASVFHCKYFENSTIAWTYYEYLFAYLPIIVSFDDVTLDVIVLFIFGLTLARDTVRSLQRNNVAFSGHQTVRT